MPRQTFTKSTLFYTGSTPNNNPNYYTATSNQTPAESKPYEQIDFPPTEFCDIEIPLMIGESYESYLFHLTERKRARLDEMRNNAAKATDNTDNNTSPQARP